MTVLRIFFLPNLKENFVQNSNDMQRQLNIYKLRSIDVTNTNHKDKDFQ